MRKFVLLFFLVILLLLIFVNMLKYALIILLVFSDELFAQVPSIDPTCIPVITIKENQNNICPGTGITFHATLINDGTAGLYKWKKNNQDVGLTANSYYTSSDFHDGDVVVCTYSCKTACGVDTIVISNSITVHVLNDITPTITIANNDPLICEGEVTVFTATAYYGSATPSYQWYVNRNPVGTNSPVFSTSSITNGAQVECVLTISTPSCPGISKSETSKMAIYVYPMIHPAITIKPSKTQICRGEEVTFTATANGGAYPKFTWKINGTITGPDAPSLITNSLHEGDIVSCVVTIDQDSRCHTSTSAPSNDIVMHVRDFPDPALKIATLTPDVCPGTNIMFTATSQNTGDYKFYQWQVNGRNEGNNSPNFVYNQYRNGDKVSCTLTTDIPGCSFSASISSNSEVVTIRDVPVITFSPHEITIMSGESAELHASVSGNTASHVWKPDGKLLTPQSLTSATVPLAEDAVFNLSVTGTNGCTASKKLNVKVLHQPYMPSVFTPNKDGKNDLFRIPPSSSLSLSQFSVFDRWGNVVFRTTDITKGWNGTYQGQDLATGTYVYLIKGFFKDIAVTIKGTVTLLR